jgi:hypothetical protein
MSKNVVLIRHGDDPADDRVVSYFRGGNIEPEIRRPFKGDALGDADGSVAASLVYGATTFGLQFHAEVTRTGFRRWQSRDWACFGKPGAQNRDEQDRLGAQHDAAQHHWFMGFLDRLFGAV